MKRDSIYKKIENICLAFKDEESIVKYFNKYDKKYRYVVSDIDSLKRNVSRINEAFPSMIERIEPYKNDPYFFIYSLFGHWGSEVDIDNQMFKRYYDDCLVGMGDELKYNKEFAMCIYSIGNRLNELGIETNYCCALRFFDDEVKSDYDVCQHAIRNDNTGTLYYFPYILNERSRNDKNNSLLSIQKLNRRHGDELVDANWYIMRHPEFLEDNDYITKLININPYFVSEIPRGYLNYPLIDKVIKNIVEIDNSTRSRALTQVDTLILKYNEIYKK